MRASFLIVFALAVGAAVGYFGPILVRAASSEAEFVFPAPDPDPKYVKLPKPNELFACDPRRKSLPPQIRYMPPVRSKVHSSG